MEKLLQDIRYGARSILKAPRFTVAAVLTLALGIGANTAMFSVIRSVLMRSWPFPNPGRLLLVSQRQANGNSNLFSTQDYLDWKQQGGLLAHMGAHVSWQFNISSPGQPAQSAFQEGWFPMTSFPFWACTRCWAGSFLRKRTNPGLVNSSCSATRSGETVLAPIRTSSANPFRWMECHIP